MPILLTIKNLTCIREGRTLFRNLNLALNSGDCVQLTGPNGSGKSTLLRCVAGLFADYSGNLEAAPFLYLGHKPGVSALLTPLAHLRWFASMTGSTGDPLQALARVGLAGYEEIVCQQMSAGQQRRVALARLLISDGQAEQDAGEKRSRPLWLLDEPFTALDDKGQELIRQLLTEHLQSGGGALCATHQDLGLAGSRALALGVTT
jgi:heme exporter protein A